MLQNLFLKEIEFTCKFKRDLNWWSRNTKWNPLTVVLMSFSNKLMLNDWIWRTPITNFLNLDENKFDHKKKKSWNKMLFEKLKFEKCTRGRKAESTGTTSWRILCTEVERKSWNNTETHFTCTRITRKDELLEWLWRIPRSRVEFLWNFFTRSQSTSKDSKSAIYAELRQTLATWNIGSTWTTGKRFCKSTFDAGVIANTLSRNSSIYGSKNCRWGLRAHQHRETCVKRGRKNREHNSNADICKKAADHELLHSIFHRVLWLGSKDSRYRNFNLTNSLLHHLFLCWKIRFRSQVTACSDFLLEAMLRIKEVQMVDSMDGLKSSRSVAGKNFPNLGMLDAKIASALNKIIQNSQFKKKVSLEEQKSPGRGPVSTRKTDRLHDLRLLSCYWCSWYSSWLRWFILYHSL